MIDFIINLVPWYVWAVLALVIAVLVHKSFGWRNALVAASVLAAGVFTSFSRDKWRKDGAEQIVKEANRDAEKAIKQARETRAAANAANSNPDRLREDDGHRRD